MLCEKKGTQDEDMRGKLENIRTRCKSLKNEIFRDSIKWRLRKKL